MNGVLVRVLTLAFGLLSALVPCRAAQDVPSGRIVAVDQFVGNLGARVYLPTKYDGTVPAPVICFERAFGIAESATFQRFTPTAEELGWIAVIVDGAGAPTIDLLAEASSRRFNVHPSLRFTFSFWNVPPAAVALGCRQKPSVAGGMAVNCAIIDPVPKGKTILWLTRGRGIESQGPPARRDETVRNFVSLAARGWPVRLDMFDGTSEPTADVLNEGARWMMRTYLRIGGRLTGSDRQPLSDFMALELEKAERHRDTGRFYQAFEIAEDLRTVKAPLQEPFTSLYNDLVASEEVQAELKVREALQMLIRAAATAYERKSLPVARQAAAGLNSLCLDHGKSHVAILAADIKSDLEARIRKGEL